MCVLEVYVSASINNLTALFRMIDADHEKIQIRDFFNVKVLAADAH